MQVAILGQGLLGRALTDALVERGYQPAVFTTKASSGVPYMTGDPRWIYKTSPNFSPVSTPG